MPETGEPGTGFGNFVIRGARSADVPAIGRLDERITGIGKPGYWQNTFARYGERPDRFFLVAEGQGHDQDRGLAGFIIGEVRAWEFGSPPSGWVFALGVDPGFRLRKIGSQLFDAICARLAQAGVDTVRTMLARDDNLNMAFFRSQGMMGGPFIQLEMPLDPAADPPRN
jgi:ribosomal protein S18 acetylase RimI-like enzyme